MAAKDSATSDISGDRRNCDGDRKKRPRPDDGGGEFKNSNSSCNEKKRNSNSKDSKAEYREKRHAEEKQQYFNRLFHQCTKDLHKQAKICKGMECQKVVRKLKSNNNKNNNNEKQQQEEEKEKKSLEEPQRQKKDLLQELKKLPLDAIVEECYSRTGILQLNPEAAGQRPKQSDKKQKKHGNEAVKTSVNEWVDELGLVHRVLLQKRMRDCLEKWHVQVTEFRRWCLQQQERLGSEFGKPSKKKMEKRKLSHAQRRHQDSSKQVKELSSSLFCQLGGDDDWHDQSNTNNDGEDYNYYGPAGDSFAPEKKKKKNRQGQRARRAKAAAIQARKEGRRVDTSLNWRQPKVIHNDPSNENQDEAATWNNKNKNKRNHSNSIGKKAAQTREEVAHPSWQAAKANKASVVAFQGTKTTFD